MIRSSCRHFSAAVCLAVATLLQVSAQDNPNRHGRITVSTNVGLNLINEANLNVDWKFSKRVAAGVGFGRIYYNSRFDPNPIAPSQDEYPGTVYDGFSFRTNVKLFEKYERKGYWCAQFLFKTMGYGNRTFGDSYQGEVSYSSYVRSESARVVGVQALHGHRWNLLKRRFAADLFYGFGLRSRYRRYTTHSSIFKGGGFTGIKDVQPALGTFKVYQTLPSVHLGINVGINVVR